MATPQDEALIRRFYEEVWNQGHLDVADEVFHPSYVRHDLRPGPAPAGPEGQKTIASAFRQAFPDVHLEIDFLISGDSYVVARWRMRGTHQGDWAGVKPTRRSIDFAGVNIFRFEAGKVVELWNHRDDLGLMQQIGAPIYAGNPDRPDA